MILVPRQLQRSGMTGGVPYYGGRLTPAQAWGASHRHTPQSSGARSAGARSGMSPSGDAPSPEPPDDSSVPQAASSALERLRESGVLTAEEYDELRGRIDP